MTQGQTERAETGAHFREETLKKTSTVRLGRAAFVCALLSQSALAHADPTDAVPPRLSRFVDAPDPRPPGPAESVGVVLEIDVDATGAVTDARVVTSASPELDAAALGAVRSFVFEPATRDGKPFAARIRYAYVFAAHATSPPPPSPPEPAPVAEPELPPDPGSFEATARVDAPAREPTRRTLDREELSRVAGTRGDPLRAVELLPGVARPSVSDNLPILRGANPFDTQVYVDGAPVPYLYHFAGLSSFIHARVLDAVDVYPSSFSVRYGRKLGGVIEARIRDPKTDGLHGIAEASFLDSSLLVETPIGDNLAVLAAARRSNIDAVVNSAQSTADLGITSAPVYWDYQSVVAFKPTDQDRLRLVGYGSSDKIGIVFGNPADSAPDARGAFEDASSFHRVQLGYRHRFHGGSESNTEVTYGYSKETGQFGNFGRVDFGVHTLEGRSEWTAVVSPALRLVAGVDLLANRFEGSYDGVAPTADEGASRTALMRKVSVEAHLWELLPGAYIEAGIRPVPRVLITPGIRVDYNDFIDEAAVDPRGSMRFEATPQTILKAGLGRYSQSPDEKQVVSPIGNPDLGMSHAIHASAGVEQAIGESASALLEGFAKWIDGTPRQTPNGRAPFFVGDQKGRVFGGELMLRLKPGGRFFGFVSYTLMRSERRDPFEAWRLFDHDQTHILGATGVLRLGRGWETGATVRYSSGNPYTPVRASSYDATTDVYVPRSGAETSERNPAYLRIDARLQKTWTFSRWSLAAYLDVQNVLNRPNRDGINYNYDYSRREGARGLPLLPILGLRGEL